MVHPRRASARPRAVVGSLVLGAALTVSLAACAQDSGASGDVIGQGYVSGDGSVRTWAADDRTDPVTLTGTDFAGDAVDTGDWVGDVVVLNTWYAGCAPCRAEAPVLTDAATTYADQGVHFLGINGTDDAGGAQAFERTFKTPYPSIADTDGSAVATLQGTVPLQAVPTTVVLDTQGRVAARVIGEVESSTLDSILDDVIAETA